MVLLNNFTPHIDMLVSGTYTKLGMEPWREHGLFITVFFYDYQLLTTVY